MIFDQKKNRIFSVNSLLDIDEKISFHRYLTNNNYIWKWDPLPPHPRKSQIIRLQGEFD